MSFEQYQTQQSNTYSRLAGIANMGEAGASNQATGGSNYAQGTLIPPAVLFLLLPISRTVWNWMPELRLLQFPWRWLVVLEAPMAIGFASAVWCDRRALRISLLAACAALFVGISVVAFDWWFLESRTFEADVLESVERVPAFWESRISPPGIRPRTGGAASYRRRCTVGQPTGGCRLGSRVGRRISQLQQLRLAPSHFDGRCL